MHTKDVAAPAFGPPTEQQMSQRIQAIKSAMVNQPLANAMKYLDEHPGDLPSATRDPRAYLEGRGVNIPADITVTIRQGNSYTLCYAVNGVSICFLVG